MSDLVRNPEDRFSHAVTFGPEVVRFFFMLNSTEHEILSAHKYQTSLN